jgi:hypothetical protein
MRNFTLPCPLTCGITSPVRFVLEYYSIGVYRKCCRYGFVALGLNLLPATRSPLIMWIRSIIFNGIGCICGTHRDWKQLLCYLSDTVCTSLIYCTPLYMITSKPVIPVLRFRSASRHSTPHHLHFEWQRCWHHCRNHEWPVWLWSVSQRYCFTYVLLNATDSLVFVRWFWEQILMVNHYSPQAIITEMKRCVQIHMEIMARMILPIPRLSDSICFLLPNGSCSGGDQWHL